MSMVASGTQILINYLGDDLDKVIEAMNATGVPYKIYKTKLGYSRV